MRPLDKNEKQEKEQRGERERGGEDTRTVTADSEGGAELPTSQQAGRTWHNSNQIHFLAF